MWPGSCPSSDSQRELHFIVLLRSGPVSGSLGKWQSQFSPASYPLNHCSSLSLDGQAKDFREELPPSLCRKPFNVVWRAALLVSDYLYRTAALVAAWGKGPPPLKPQRCSQVLFRPRPWGGGEGLLEMTPGLGAPGRLDMSTTPRRTDALFPVQITCHSPAQGKR